MRGVEGNRVGQPPPRGCVLKHSPHSLRGILRNAAASARLCVETGKELDNQVSSGAAASARLCVETIFAIFWEF